MTSVSDVTAVRYSGDLRVDSLLYATVDWNYLLPGRTTLYYTFDLSAVDPGTSAALTAFNTAQQAAAIGILSYTTSVTGIRFAQTASGTSADFHFASYNLAGAATAGLTHGSEVYSYTGGNVLTDYSAEAFIYLDNAEFFSLNSNPTKGSGGYEVLLHEIGHALGLGHPFDGLYVLPASQDNTNNTVMSYTEVGAPKATFQVYDLLALQWLYGGDGLQGAYGINSSYGPLLAAAIAVDSTSGNDYFNGGPGNNSIDGGGGIDTAIFSGKIADYSINYKRALGTATVTDHRLGGDGTDSLKSIEKLQFADKTFDLLNLPRTATPNYGKTPSFLFDASYYFLSHPDLVPTVSLSTAYDHYKYAGAAQGAAPNVWFDPVYYANRWPDLKVLNLDASTLFSHYNLYGVWEGRSAGPVFDQYNGVRYLQDNPDVARYVDANVQDFLGSRSNGAIAHYLIYGADEGRNGFDLAGNAIELAILIGAQPA